MKKMLSKLLSLAVALSMAVSMVACGSAPEEEQQSSTAPDPVESKVEETSEEKVTLKVEYFENATGSTWFDELKKGFEEEYPNVTVELKGDPEATEKMGPMLEANDKANLPDVAFILNTSWQIWADKGYLADLTDLYEGECWEGGKSFKDTMNNGAQEYSMYRDKAMIIPWSDGVLGMAYNKGMFEEHNWEVPETWAEMEELCEKIKAEGIAPFVYPGQIMGYWDFTVQPMIVSYGGMEYHNDFLEMETIEPWKNEARLAAYG